MPHMIAELEEVDAPVRAIAEHWKDAGFFLYLGRHVGLSICLEGALKLKEISYIPTDAYAAGEMKHGPIALLDERTPVVCVATDSPVLDKVMSNIAEVQARGAHVVAVTTEGTHVDAEEVVKIPRTDWLLQPVLAIVPLQLLAYHIARERGLNVDQPRNLAKTVTVECFRAVSGVGIDLLEVEREAPEGGRAGGARVHRRRASLRAAPPAHAPGGPLLREGGGGQGARHDGVELARRGGGGHRRRARGAAHGSVAAARPSWGDGTFADPHGHDGRRRALLG